MMRSPYVAGTGRRGEIGISADEFRAPEFREMRWTPRTPISVKCRAVRAGSLPSKRLLLGGGHRATFILDAVRASSASQKPEHPYLFVLIWNSV